MVSVSLFYVKGGINVYFDEFLALEDKILEITHIDYDMYVKWRKQFSKDTVVQNIADVYNCLKGGKE